MPVHTPDRFVTETTPVEGAAEPNQTQWISEVGERTQFGAFIEVLQPGCRSSIKHWHAAEDEMVYVLAGEITAVPRPRAAWWWELAHPSTALCTPITIGYFCVIARYQTTYGRTWLVILLTVPTRLVRSFGRAV